MQVSFGPVSWLMVSEIFPLRSRGRALSLATLVNFASNAVVAFAFAPLQVSSFSMPSLNRLCTQLRMKKVPCLISSSLNEYHFIISE